MLIKDVVQNYPGRVEFVNETYGNSALAARYGIKKYPVVFVDDVLVAKPEDFGWFGAEGKGKFYGKYTPWKAQSSHEKFKKDLARMIELALHGDKEAISNEAKTTTETEELRALPAFSMKDISGKHIDSASLAGRVVVVEFWATWCVPCRTTIGYLGKIKQRYGDRVSVLAIAVESTEEDVRKLILPMKLPVNTIVGSGEEVAPFGDLTSVPTLFIFDRQGNTASIFYGASKDLHEKVGGLIDSLLK